MTSTPKTRKGGILLPTTRAAQLAATFFVAWQCLCHATGSLVPNGDFEKLDAKGIPSGWGAPNDVVSFPEEDGNHFLRITSGGPEKMAMVYREYKLPEIYPAFTLSYKVRHTDVQRGAENYFDARIMMNIKTADGKKSGLSAPNFTGFSDGWVEKTHRYELPPSARSIEFMPTMFKTTGGTFDLDDIRIIPEGEGRAIPPPTEKPKPVTTRTPNAAPAKEPVADTLFRNGSFEEKQDGKDWPKHWPGGAAQYLEEDGNHFLRLESQGTDKLALFFYYMAGVPQGFQFLELSCKARWSDIKRGKDSWHDARFMMNFIDDTGKKTGAPAVTFTGSSDGWVEIRHKMPVPRGAISLEIMPCHFNSASGVLDLDDLTLTAVDPVEDSAVAMPAEAMLFVKGNRLYTRHGEETWLQGVAIPSLEWSAKGEHIRESFTAAIKDWQANCIRLPVKSSYWFGKGKHQPDDGGQAYRALVDDLIGYASSNACYVVLDLHEYKAPTQVHADFWQDAAVRYANHPAVLFDILNEPHGISWEEWRDGGKLSNAKREGAIDENDEAKDVDTSIGMQRLIDVIRATGAKNIIVAGGLDWAYDLSGIVKGFALEEKGGNGIMYSTHIYPWKSDWNGKVLAAAQHHPIFIGEVGCQTKPMPFEKAALDPYKWAPDMLAFIQKNKLNWTAWSFHPKASPCVISDWDYTPTPYWGAFVRAALRGMKFTSDRIR